MAKKNGKTNVANEAVELVSETANTLQEKSNELIDAERIIASKILCLAVDQLIWHNNIPTIDPMIFVDFCYKVVGVSTEDMDMVSAKLFYIKKKDGVHINEVVVATGEKYKKGDETLYDIKQLTMKKSRNGFTYWKVVQK